MPFSNLKAREKKIASQNGEDGVIGAIFEQIGVTNRFCVEFGCEGGTECNTAYLLDHGWTGLLMDCAQSRNSRFTVQKEFVTAENIQPLLRKYQVPPDFDLISIDIDGNDLWVWNAIEYRARVVVIEYNPCIPPHLSRTIPYDPGFVWPGDNHYGASLLALQTLGQVKGYTLIYCESTGTNAFFVANEALPANYKPRPIEEIYRPQNIRNLGYVFAPNRTRIMIDPFPSSVGHFQVDTGCWVVPSLENSCIARWMRVFTSSRG